MKKLILTVAVISSMFSLTACGEKKVEAKQPEVQAPVASPVQASGTDAENFMKSVVAEDINDATKPDFLWTTDNAEFYLHKKTRQHGEYKFVVAQQVVKKDYKDMLKDDRILIGTDVDCQNKQFRSVFSIMNRKGKIEYAPKYGDWMINPPQGSMGEKLITTVCSR